MRNLIGLIAAGVVALGLAGCQTTSDQADTDQFVKSTLQSQGVR